MEPRAFLTLVGRQEAQARTGEGPKVGVSNIRQNSHTDWRPGEAATLPKPSLCHVTAQPNGAVTLEAIPPPSTVSPMGGGGLGPLLPSVGTSLSLSCPSAPPPSCMLWSGQPHSISKAQRMDLELSSPVTSEGRGSGAGHGGREQKSHPRMHRHMPAHPDTPSARVHPVL